MYVTEKKSSLFINLVLGTQHPATLSRNTFSFHVSYFDTQQQTMNDTCWV